MNLFGGKGCKLIFSRDYHPVDHVSFNSEGGPFPSHCVEGHVGSHVYI